MAAIPHDKLPAIIERLKNGSSLGQEAKALGMSYRTTLIETLRAFMGRGPYDEMIATFRRKPKGAPRTEIGTVARPRLDDAGVEVVESMRKSDGWSWRYVNERPPREVKVPLEKSKGGGYVSAMDGGEKFLIMCSPEGLEYVEAADAEKADLLRVNPINHDGPRIRFVLWENSRTRQRVEKNHVNDMELIERGKAAAVRKREKANTTVEDVQKKQEQIHKQISKNSTKKKNSTKAKKKAKRSA